MRERSDATDAPVDAMVLAGQYVYCATESGKLVVFSTIDGRQLAAQDIRPIVWDGMAAANGCPYASTKVREIVCLGKANASNQ